MNLVLHGAHFVTEKNLTDLVASYKEQLRPTRPGNSTDPEPGDVIVIRRFSTTDPWDEDLEHWHEVCWLATRPEFDDKFYIVDDLDPADHFVLIRLKK
jgi:hypothetical protein